MEDAQKTNFNYSLRIDGSFVNNSYLASIGWTLNDSNGNLIGVDDGASSLKANDLFQTELYVCYSGMLDMESRSLSNFLIPRDSLLLYQSIAGMIYGPPKYNSMIETCKNTLFVVDGKN